MITIQRQTDVVALAAFVLAFGAAIAQILAWTRGPDVTLLGPERVALYLDSAPDGSRIVRVAAPLAYANTAEQTYAAILSGEKVTLTFGPLRSEQEWNAFGEIGQEAGRLVVRATGLTSPQTVSAQSALSHVTLFAPLRHPCEGERRCDPAKNYLSPEELAGQLKPDNELRLEFDSLFFPDDRERHACAVTVTENIVRRWQREQALYAKCRVAAPAEPTGPARPSPWSWLLSFFRRLHLFT